MPTFPMNSRRAATSFARLLPALAAPILILGVATTARAGEAFLGEVRLLPHTTAPQGWLECNGQVLPINQNQAVFSLLSTTFGGNGQTTFALPNLHPVKLARGELRYYIAVVGIFPSPN